MTVCMILKQTEKSEYNIIAEKRIDKYSSIYNYSIIVAKGSMAIKVYPTAKTTWRKKYNDILNSL